MANQMTFDVEQCVAAVACLTPRQREIVALIAAGRSSKEIADELGISVRTEEHHREQIYFRLGVRNAAGLVRVAVNAKVV